jgi:hypothetical protein
MRFATSRQTRRVTRRRSARRALKRAAGRPKDNDAVAELEVLLDEQQKKDL